MALAGGIRVRLGICFRIIMKRVKYFIIYIIILTSISNIFNTNMVQKCNVKIPGSEKAYFEPILNELKL